MKITHSSISQAVLVTGATGYIGSRLVPRLLAIGVRVKALARHPEKITSRPWGMHPNLEIVEGDILESVALARAVSDCRVVFYLVHSMRSEVGDFAEADRLAAGNMVEAAAAVGVRQIIYLGGLGQKSEGLSSHLRSRHEVADILQTGSVPVTVLRAAMIIGSGSASFEILRYLVDRLPIMITPRWIDTPCQPIAVRNVLAYLVGCLDNQKAMGKVFDIGQPEILTYRRLMTIYAEEAGLRPRLVIPVPVLTPRLSSYWIHLITPVPAYLARPLAEGLKNPVVCLNDEIQEVVPQELLSCREAIRRALERLQQHEIESSWTDAGAIPPAEWSIPGDPQWAGGTMFQDGWRLVLDGTCEDIWNVISRMGGDNGWYYADWLWRLRGWLDRLVGGVGLRRGRRDDKKLAPGDALDFWRVVCVAPFEHLLLVAEMKLPGEAVLDFSLHALDGARSELIMTARFLPRGLLGILYWYLVSPFHTFVFRGMLNAIGLRTGREIHFGPQRIPSSDIG